MTQALKSGINQISKKTAVLVIISNYLKYQEKSSKKQ
jgi:hypothetical protein